MPRNGLQDTPASCLSGGVLKLMTSTTFSKKFEVLISVCRSCGMEPKFSRLLSKLLLGKDVDDSASNSSVAPEEKECLSS